MLRILLILAFRRSIKNWKLTLFLALGVALSVSTVIAVVRVSSASVASFASNINEIESNYEIRSKTDHLSLNDLIQIAQLLHQYASVTPVYEKFCTANAESYRVLVADCALLGLNFDKLSFSEEPAAFFTQTKIESFARTQPKSINICGQEVMIAGQIPKNISLANNSALFDLSNSILDIDKQAISFIRVIPHYSNAQDLAERDLEFNKLLEQLSQRYQLESLGVRQDKLNRMLFSYRLNIMILVLISIFLCLFIIFSTTQLNALLAQRETIILKLLGSSLLQVALPLVLQALIVALLGSLWGVLFGAQLAELTSNLMLGSIEAFYNDSLSLSNTQFIEENFYVVVFVLSLALCLLGSFYPAIVDAYRTKIIRIRAGKGLARANRRSVARAVKTYALTLCAATGVVLFIAEYASRLSYFLIVLVLLLIFAASREIFIFFKLLPAAGVNNLLLRSKLVNGASERHAFVVVLSVAISLVIAITIMVDSFRGTLINWMDSSLKADLFLRSAQQQITQDLVQQIKKIDSVDQISRFSSRDIKLDDKNLKLSGIDLYSGDNYRKFQIIAATKDIYKIEAAEMIVSESAAEKLALKLSQRVDIEGKYYIVIAIVRDYTSDQGLIFLTYEEFSRLFPQQKIESLSVYLKDKIRLDSIKTQIESLLTISDISLSNNYEIKRSVLDIFDTTFAITRLIILLIIFVAAIGAAIFMAQLLILEREQYKFLSELGVSLKQIQRYLCFESLSLICSALVIAILAGHVLAWILVFKINPIAFGWSLDWNYNFAQLLSTLSFSLLPVVVLQLMLVMFYFKNTIKIKSFEDD